MSQEEHNVRLVVLAPTPDEKSDVLMNYAAQLASILNSDCDLPNGYLRPKDHPPLTAEGILEDARSWCRGSNAISFAVVLNDSVVGAISLSHIDYDRKSARTGYFIKGTMQGRGIGTAALKQLLDITRKHGIKSVSASVAEHNLASRRIWEKCGIPLHVQGETISVKL